MLPRPGIGSQLLAHLVIHSAFEKEARPRYHSPNEDAQVIGRAVGQKERNHENSKACYALFLSWLIPSCAMESLFSSYPSEISIENYTTLAVLMIMSYCNTVPALIPAVVVSDQRPPSGGRTFRIRGVPNDWDKDRLESFLAEKDGSAGLAVQSLANEIHGRSQTATVSSQSTSYLPQRIPLPLFSDQLRKSRSLTLDLDFLGITALFAPPQQDHKVE